ncbi:sn-glycerol-1-phosphate dehydrogenase [Salinispira pacifica]
MKNLLQLVMPDGCSPGRPKDLEISEILSGPEVIDELPALLRRLADAGRWRPGRIAVLCDRNTRGAAGSDLEAVLRRSGNPYLFCELKAAPGGPRSVNPKEGAGGTPGGDSTASHDPDILPDERAIGTALLAVPPDTALVMSLGSGTITDIARYVAARTRLPFVAVATAPSVDGFTSSVAPLIVDGLKTTIDAAPPAAVLGDSRILAGAPKRLLGAGVGDLAGKLTARIDWLLALLINGEARCDYIIELVAGYVRRALSMERSEAASPEGAADLFEGLVVSGLGITLVGSSRPASGAEHHISHFLEMQHERGNAPRLYHGESVAVGTYLVTKLYHRLVARPFEELEASVHFALSAEGKKRFEKRSAERVALTGELFGDSAELLVQRHLESRPTPERRKEVLRKLRSGWEELRRTVAEHLPEPEELSRSLSRLPVPHKPEEIGISRELLHSALLCAKQVRTRYSLLSLLDELGMLEQEADALAAPR